MDRHEKDVLLRREIEGINFDRHRVGLVSGKEMQDGAIVTLRCEGDALDELRAAVQAAGAEIASALVNVRLDDDDVDYEAKYNKLLAAMKNEFKELHELINDAPNVQKRLDLNLQYGSAKATLAELLENEGVQVYE